MTSKKTDQSSPTRDGRSRATLARAVELAMVRGGTCLSETCDNSKTPLDWRCSAGHEWQATYGDIAAGRWCTHCKPARQRYTINDARKIAAMRGGECLSTTMTNGKQPLRMRCGKGHEWEVPYAALRRTSWCPHCAGKVPLDIEELRELARLRGGQCLSTERGATETKLRWRCAEGHEWMATAGNIKKGRWCGRCQNKSEELCRQIVEASFGAQFPRIKPGWLLNSRGRRLELDGYNEELRLAFEYQGEQHYRLVKAFHDEDDFAWQLQCDREKEAIAISRGVTLVPVRYFDPRAGLAARVEQVIATFIASGATPPRHDPIKVLKALKPPTAIMDELRTIAASHGGELLTPSLLGRSAKHTWRCAEGHVFEASPRKMARWCPSCAGRTPRKRGIQQTGEPKLPRAVATLAKMQELARERGGECLSDTYTNGLVPLEWRCAHGHTWQSLPANVRQGTWCPACANARRGGRAAPAFVEAADSPRLRPTQEDTGLRNLHQVARERGGECLTHVRPFAKAKLLWRCSRGHQWQARGSTITGGHWCPTCAQEENVRRNPPRSQRDIAD